METTGTESISSIPSITVLVLDVEVRCAINTHPVRCGVGYTRIEQADSYYNHVSNHTISQDTVDPCRGEW